MTVGPQGPQGERGEPGARHTWRQLVAYAGVTLAFAASIGYVVNDQNHHAREDARDHATIVLAHHLAQQTCAYEWITFDRRIKLDNILLELVVEEHRDAIAAEIRTLIRTVPSPSCQRP